jgi:capsular exopolysaccharide synthesis family protein
MSKFFNETLKTQNPVQTARGFELAGLQEPVTTEEQPDLGVYEFESAPPEVAQAKKIEIPETMLLSKKFEGSHSLQSAEEAYRALRTRLFRLRSTMDLRSIIITSSVPGEGKTLTSFNLALCCSQLKDVRVLLIDGDIRTGGLTRSLGALASPGLADVLAGKSDAEAAVFETNHSNLYVCGSGATEHSPGELYAGRRWQEFMAWCKGSFQLVVVDSPPIMTLSDVELMAAACDGVLLAVRARQTRRDVLQKFASQIDAKKLLGIVYNFSEGPHHKYHYSGKKER